MTYEEITIPTTCPSCESPLETFGLSGQLRCTGTDCIGTLNRRLVHWASRKAADIDGLSTKMIEQLVDLGYLRTVADFYHLTGENFVEIGRSREFGNKMLAAIETSKGVGMRRALIGLSIPNAGEGTAERVTKEYESIELLSDASMAALASVPDVGLVVATSLNEFLSRPDVNKLVSDLRGSGVNLDRLPEDAPLEFSGAEGGFAGLTVVVTGTLTIPRDDFKALLVQNGAKMTGSVSGKTDVLVAGQNVGAAKTNKAKQLGVKVVDEETARSMMGL